MTETRNVTVRILAIHAACEACGGTARIPGPDCEAYARWASVHVLPTLVAVDALVDGQVRRTPAGR